MIEKLPIGERPPPNEGLLADSDVLFHEDVMADPQGYDRLSDDALDEVRKRSGLSAADAALLIVR